MLFFVTVRGMFDKFLYFTCTANEYKSLTPISQRPLPPDPDYEIPQANLGNNLVPVSERPVPALPRHDSQEPVYQNAGGVRGLKSRFERWEVCAVWTVKKGVEVGGGVYRERGMGFLAQNQTKGDFLGPNTPRLLKILICDALMQWVS